MGEKGRKMVKKWIALIILVLLLSGAMLAGLVWTGLLWPNDFLARKYPVRGVDVSVYQGTIEWDVLAAQEIDFAFIKATEGSGYVDPNFAQNWAGAQAAGLKVGAYHFFSFDSPGSTQAENFIAAVPKTADMLPPVVDVELYGTHHDSPPDPEAVRAELRTMLDALEEHYGMKPILYSLKQPYELYLAGEFEDYDLWARNILGYPWRDDWTFWQYSSREQLKGYAGEEKYIDMNVFCGSRAEFLRWAEGK